MVSEKDALGGYSITCHCANRIILRVLNGLPEEARMSAGIALRDAPRRFLGAERWAELRSFAKSDLIALTYINAPYPDEGTPNSFFCGYEGSFEEALHCYQLGRKLVDEARQLFVQGK